MKNYREQEFERCCEKCNFVIIEAGSENHYCNFDKSVFAKYENWIRPYGICDNFKGINETIYPINTWLKCECGHYDDVHDGDGCEICRCNCFKLETA